MGVWEEQHGPEGDTKSRFDREGFVAQVTGKCGCYSGENHFTACSDWPKCAKGYEIYPLTRPVTQSAVQSTQSASDEGFVELPFQGERTPAFPREKPQSAYGCGCDPGYRSRSGLTEGYHCENHPNCTYGKAMYLAQHNLMVVQPNTLTDRRGHPKFYQLIDEITALHDKKNADYAAETDPLSNFRKAERFGIPAWKGVLVRMADKWSRLEELASGVKTPQNESLRDSLIDLAVYALICVVLREEE